MDAHVGTISLEYAKCTLYTPSLRSVMSNPTPDSGNDTPHEQPTEAVPPPPDHPTDVTAPLPPPNTWQQPQGQPGPQQPAGPNTFITAVNDQVAVSGQLAQSRTVEAFQQIGRAHV